MRLVANAGRDRALDLLHEAIEPDARLDLCSPRFSLFAFAALEQRLEALASSRILLPGDDDELELLGGAADRAARNRLDAPWLARQCAEWVRRRATIKRASGAIPQGACIVGSDGGKRTAVHGAFSFTTDGLGLAPGNPLSLIQCAENDREQEMLAQWFEQIWRTVPEGAPDLPGLAPLMERRSPAGIYALILDHLFANRDGDLDEDKVVKAATGIRSTVVWRKLYKFQRDGVIGAIDKLERYGGCIIADSVGLGKTFEALAIIKYAELRNDRVLVLCPKRLRDNWTLYKANDRRNILAADRFNYDVLNHTDLSRDDGLSGDIDLAHVNWGNYDLVVIDESHNFRNKRSPKAGGETRYDRLMRRIVREGVKTRVLMLSATPVNSRLSDLRNQIAFTTEGADDALAEVGIASIDATTRLAQKQFNRWLQLEDGERTPRRLVEMLGFDYFMLLDALTIARSRKHVEKYYGTVETGRFPERLKPINIRAAVDLEDELPSIRDINREIRRLHLAAYAPLRYVLPQRLATYEAKYATEIRGGESVFRQIDREESLIHLMRVNLLKRLESAVGSFALTIERQLASVEALLARLDEHPDSVGEVDASDIDLDDPAFESLVVGRTIKVLVDDLDLIRWRQDLLEDRNRLRSLHGAAKNVNAHRDAKLAHLREVIEAKCRAPINPGNRKVIVFTAFTDTAEYLFSELAPWAKHTLGLESGLVSGGSRPNQSTIATLRRDMGSILSAFAPRAKERPADLESEGQIDLLIATDCISEGQNLQDCDWLVNYDIHWNPVRIIQRFGRIDRLGSVNERIQLVNFWPDLELEEYINLEQRVSGRMVLLDISATGEENLIERQSGDLMNDLEYRRAQLLRLQDAVIDLEDLSSGVSIADLTLTDFRIDLADYHRAHPQELEHYPLGARAAATATPDDLEPGIVFCLRAESEAALRAAPHGYPLLPYFLVHVGANGTVVLGHTEAKRTLDQLKRLCVGRELVDIAAWERFERATRGGEDMRGPVAQLGLAIDSIVGASAERAVASLFSPGGTHAIRGERAGVEDFEVVAYLVVSAGGPQ